MSHGAELCYVSFMGYRRARSEPQYALRWRSFRERNVELFERAALPGLLADHAEFSYFVEHSYVPTAGEGATTSMFGVDQLDEAQRAALHTLIAAYGEEFGDLDASGLRALLSQGDA
jgi:hypothetical protein